MSYTCLNEAARIPNKTCSAVCLNDVSCYCTKMVQLKLAFILFHFTCCLLLG